MRTLKLIIVLIGWLTLAAHGCLFMSAKAEQQFSFSINEIEQ